MMCSRAKFFLCSFFSIFFIWFPPLKKWTVFSGHSYCIQIAPWTNKTPMHVSVLKTSKSHCKVIIITLWLWITNEYWVIHHWFVGCFIQQAENWPEYLPGLLLHECRPSSFDCFWQWQQKEAAREEIIPNGNRTIWPKSKLKHYIYICPLSLFSIMW